LSQQQTGLKVKDTKETQT